MIYVKANQDLHSLTNKTVHDIPDKIYQEYRKKWDEYPKNFYIDKFPLHLDIELSSYCNLKCPFCMRQVFNVSAGFMDFELFKKIIDEGSEKGLYAIKLNYRGEPLLHPLIFSMIKYAKDKEIIDVSFNTNAVKLTKAVSEKLINIGLDRINISFEGYTKEVYEKNRLGANFEKVLNNIKYLERLRKERKSINPRIRIQTVSLPEINLENYTKFWDKIVDQVAYLDYRIEYNSNSNYSNWACPYPWQRLTITYEGKILSCVHDYQEYSILGNIKEITLEEAWHSKKEKELRILHKKGQSHKNLSCNHCAFRSSQIKKLI